jgi:nucleoside-diphosphate-sugar epimerase
MKQKVLITGGFGYVGSRLTPLLLQQGYHVKVIDLCLYGFDGLNHLETEANFNQWKDRFEFIEGDIRDPKKVEEAINGVDAIIHLAAISNDPTGEIDDTMTKQVNFDAVGLLVHTAKKFGVKRFINASSSSVFGKRDEANINETLEPEPITSYSKYKMLSEWIVKTAATEDFCTVNIRPATICGVSPRQRFDLTVNKLTADAVRKKTITVHGGQQRRPNVGMNDIINLYSTLLTIDSSKINGKTFNFGFENHKIIDIAKIIQEELGEEGVNIDVTKTFDQRDYHISSDKIISELGYNPTSSIAKEVQFLKQFLQDNEKVNIDDPKFYNMETMKLKRLGTCYQLFAE